MAEERISPIQRRLADIRRDAEERDAARRAARTGSPYIDLRKAPVSMDALRLVPEATAKDARLVSVELKVRDVALAAYDPSAQKTKAIIDDLASRKYAVKLFTTSLSGLEQVWQMYKFAPEETKDITGKFEISRVEALLQNLVNLQLVGKEVEKLEFQKITTTNLFEVILAGALGTHASDIHFEAEEKSARIRLRLDGLLHDVFTALPLKNYDALLSRIKLLSGLKINVRGEPQDGRFTIGLSAKEIEVRVSIIPSEFGEAVVMRILDPSSILVDLPKLGLRPDNLALVETELAKPNGLILNTGPTGSGKTTTLYAFLRRIVDPETKIITVEDPIEYRVLGIEQTQVNPDVGYTFAGGLRAILRQDPDAILIGEIRDKETADIALQASLTGHLVFSTLHTNDAAGAVPRLVDLGVRPATVGPALTLVIAQRLVRKFCLKCRAPADVDPKLNAKFAEFVGRLPAHVDRTPYENPKIMRAVGCEACSNLGYKGRIGIFEFFHGGPELEELILKEVSEVSLKKLAGKQEMVTMQEDGVLKVIIGETDISEVEKVTGPIPWLHK